LVEAVGQTINSTPTANNVSHFETGFSNRMMLTQSVFALAERYGRLANL